MTCPNCSSNNEEKAKFCIECGTKLERKEVETAEQIDTNENSDAAENVDIVDINEKKESTADENTDPDIKEKLEAYTAVTTDFASVKSENEANDETNEETPDIPVDSYESSNENIPSNSDDECEASCEEIIETAETAEKSEEDAEDNLQQTEDIPQQTEEELPVPGKKKNIRKAILIAIVLVLAAAVCFAVAFVPDKEQTDYSKYPVVYTKDGQLMVRPKGKKESYKLCKSGNYYPYDDTLYSSTLQYTTDGDMIFFADDLSAGIYDLYCRKTREMAPKDGKKGTKIAKNVSMFQVVPDEKAVVYLADDKLFYSDLHNERKIADSIRYFIVTDNGEMVFYEDDEGGVFICGLDDDDKPSKVDSNIQSFVTPIDDYKEMYYVKNDKLYYKKYGSKAKKIDSGVAYAFELDGNVFTLKPDTVSYTFDDLFVDDISQDTENLVDPESLEEPDYEDYDDSDAYREAYDAYKEEYLKLKEAWQDIDKKEEIEKAFEETPFEVTTYTMYMIKEGKGQKIADNIMTPSVDTSHKYGFFKKVIPFEIEKTELSKLESAEDAKSGFDEKVNSSLEETKFCVVTSSGKTYEAFETDKAVTNIRVSDTGKYLYMIMSDDADVDGDLVRYNISYVALTKRKLIMEKVDSYTYYNDKFLTTLNDDREFMAYFDGKSDLISESQVEAVYYKDGALYFLDDYRNMKGRLTSYKDGEKKVYAKNVNSFRVYDKNRIAYVGKYNSGKGTGNLYTCNKKAKSKQIDKNVNTIF